MLTHVVFLDIFIHGVDGTRERVFFFLLFPREASSKLASFPMDRLRSLALGNPTEEIDCPETVMQVLHRKRGNEEQIS
jgi:hypothetical protein